MRRLVRVNNSHFLLKQAFFHQLPPVFSFTHPYTMRTIHLLLIHIFLLVLTFNNITATDEDTSTMDAFMDAVTPTPKGWSRDTHFCGWLGIICDSENRVISIDIASQFLYGTLPPTLNRKCEFLGPLPSLANLRFLRKAYLGNNKFTSIPVGAFAGLLDLEELSIPNSPELLLWPFPSELFLSSKLSALDAANANIAGSIPDIFGYLPNLLSLDLTGNNLSNTLPSSLNGSRIQKLTLSNQNPGLSGSIDVLCGAKKLSVVKLDGNQFTGHVPRCFISLPGLSVVGLQNNQFQGQAPKFVEKVKVYLGNNFCACAYGASILPIQENIYFWTFVVMISIIGFLFGLLLRLIVEILSPTPSIVISRLKGFIIRHCGNTSGFTTVTSRRYTRLSDCQGNVGQNVNAGEYQYVGGLTVGDTARTGIEIAGRQDKVVIIKMCSNDCICLNC